MDINFLPAPLSGPPPLVVSLEELRFVPGGIDRKIAWARENGFGGVELLATGEPASGIHAPTVDAGDRARLQETLQNMRLVVQAPHQQTWDVTLVSPSSAIRRASLSEIWSVCRFAGAVGDTAMEPPVVLVRTGTPPLGMGSVRVLEILRESLHALDRMAGEHRVRIGLLPRDVLENPDDWEMVTSGLQHTGFILDVPHLLDQAVPLTQIAALLRRFAGLFVSVRVPHVSEADRAFLADTLRQTGYGHIVSLVLSPGSGETDEEAQTGAACREWSHALRHGQDAV